MQSHFTNLKNAQFINLTTFRKSGAGVSTAVWFAQDNNRLVMTTNASAGKVKRIRNNAKVELAPCDMRGKCLGDTLQAQAKILQGDEARAAEKLLKKKYGLQWSLFSMANRNDNRVYIELTPPK
ncbi:MAG: PPOX class F420-dependent oxidoreductase [Chloroflexi bacterium]|nr:PPOX class F420-dependent oxidoreductase [Chloroflexota bacterium]